MGYKDHQNQCTVKELKSGDVFHFSDDSDHMKATGRQVLDIFWVVDEDNITIEHAPMATMVAHNGMFKYNSPVMKKVILNK